MLQRIVKAFLGALILVSLSGCIEMTQTITLNPDGRGKVVLEVIAPADLGFDFGPKEKKEKTPEELLAKYLEENLTKPGVTAWKDVSIKWTNDGRLHFTGTAYFDKLDNLGPEKKKEGPSGPSMDFGVFHLALENGLMKITAKKVDNPNPNADPNDNPKGFPDFDPTKATAKQWDNFVLKSRIAYQKSKPFMVMMLTDLKVKTVFRLPGEVKESRGFKKGTDREVSHTVDGAEILVTMKKFMTQDVAQWKRLMKEFNPKNEPIHPEKVLDKLGFPEGMIEPKLTVYKLGKAQFDYDREVQEARAAYPRLREQLKLDPSKKLSGEK